MQWIYLSYPKKCITDKIHKKIFVTKWIRTQTHLETSIPTEQPYGFNEGDQLFTSDNGTQFGLSSESHLANTLLHPTSKAIWNLYWGMCHPGNRNRKLWGILRGSRIHPYCLLFHCPRDIQSREVQSTPTFYTPQFSHLLQKAQETKARLY